MIYSVLNEYAVRIPKDYARGEASSYPDSLEKVKSIPHYELRIERQIGTISTKRPAYVLFKLPESGTYIPIILYPTGGVEFDKKFHKNLIRETDELDRRIILGFCLKHQYTLFRACYDDEEYSSLTYSALWYKVSDMPKRLKSGEQHSRWSPAWKYELAPYDENTTREYGIFSGVRFLCG